MVKPNWLRLLRDGPRQAVALLDVVERVQAAAAVELKDVAVEVVGPRLRDDVDLRAGVASELGAVGVGLNLKLAHRLGKDRRGRERHRDVVVVRTVDGEVVVARSLAVGRDAVRAGRDVDVRGQQREVEDIARRRRGQLLCLPLRDRQADGRVRLVERDGLGLRGHVDRLGYPAGFAVLASKVVSSAVWTTTCTVFDLGESLPLDDDRIGSGFQRG